ncbi:MULTISPECIES: ester cyclase [Halorussus]|uniref:ester cyclase n=1 Tax=Halorussus TaxID=1070314 RepID=UPI0020A14FFA|nr:ester cyclase [Halorussus vallis]USZ75145.1 ester cyclase [Halorussus vallis]
MATTQDNERLHRRITEEVWEQKNYDAIDELVAEDYVLHDPSMPEPVRGRDEYREMAEMGASIVDGPIEIDQLLAMDDYVVSRWTQRGTHVGKMGNVEPTNEEVTINGIDINRFEDGKLAETWAEVNLLNMLMQVGAIPADLFESAPSAEE